MSEERPKKRFFKIPENFAEASDAEIDAFAQAIFDALLNKGEAPEENLR